MSDKDKIRAWTLRLSEEYNHICYSYRLKIKRPVITVSELTGKWGLYDGETRTLSLSSRLIETYPWTVVLEVLKHEICHQIVFEVLQSDELHGPLFKETAKKLGLSPWATRAESDLDIPLHDLMENKLSPDEERLSGRVEKLLSLATSSNEHEAAAAMQKVQELYTKYNFDKTEKHAESKMQYLCLNLKKKRTERYQSAIASLLAEHFFVEIIHTSIFDPEACTEFKALEILGRRENVAMAEYVFHFLENQLKLHWNEYSAKEKKSRRSKTSFYLGLISGFREKLEESGKLIEKEYGSNSTALVKVQDAELKNFVKERYPRLTRIYHGSRLHDSDSYSFGKSKGKSLTLHKGIHKKGLARLFLR